LGFSNPKGFLLHLWRPQGRAAGAARALALVYLMPFGISLLTILKTFYFIPADLYQLSLSVGIMIALAAFAAIYLNYLPETTSFVVKLVGVTLVALLAVLGAVGWTLTPIYAKLYRPTWPDHQTLRFTPNDRGGYDVELVPFHFESDLGDRLNLMDTIHKTEQQTIVKLNFDFSFYGKIYSQVYATNDGTIAMGQALVYYDYQYHYGGKTPLIFPILTDLIPEAGQGQVFARRETDRLVLTWDRVPSFYHREAVFTFQVVLYHSGVFEITYNGLPEPMEYRANDDPMANVWLIGSLPGDSAFAPQRLDVSQLVPSTIGGLAPGRAITSGPQGITQDYYLDFRRHLHTLLLPLAYLTGGASLLVVFGFPFLFYFNLVNPLNALLAGVRRMNQGQFDTTITPQYQDEIGFLAQSFNAMSATLRDLIGNLEKRVAERTLELEQAKARVESANTQLADNVRELAARNQELDAFAHTVAHDIRGPVGQIVGYAELLNEAFDELSDAERHQALGTLVAAGDKLTNIIDELLLLAGLRNVEVQPEPLDMGAIVRGALARLVDVIQHSGATISLPDDAAWPVVLGHPAWIEEVWVNYLSNACKYGGLDDAPPRITVGADYPLPNEGQGGGAIRFWVHDAGRGIAPQDQARLFTPFTRLDQVRAQGHGLGLSIVSRIVERLGGQVSVESDGVPGHGSAFYFTLPAAPAGTPQHHHKSTA
jgi:signal transduction histidine kinase